jgi:enoyl-CoA hydratase/carnithine racemase
VAASTATIGFVFTKLALHPGMAATFYLPKLIGAQAAAQLLLTGDIVSAARAKELGLVMDVVDSDASPERAGELVVDHAMGLAASLAANDSVAARLLLRTLREDADRGLDRALLREADAQAICYGTPEYRAKVEKMMQKK